uniref:Uncharacterized protein AlNc14C85G5474 n=1 Tax=Albugo laibachii Nc14 TaxID=890382 RepID=F0WFT9_9STRA|nr:conserved hypothetical protein [Albugo laibachii Nc14]|eukprot:CCA20073.1 conserved hypothetical protein [Albugo laibachii Nc14]
MQVEIPSKILPVEELTRDWTEETILNILENVHLHSKFSFVVSGSRKEVITLSKLENELREQIDLHQGRVSIQVLTRILDVEQCAIENCVSNLVNSSKHTTGNDTEQKRFYIISGGEEVITNEYIDIITDEIGFILNEIGTLALSALSRDYNLSVEYLKEAVLSRLKPQFHKDAIHSHSYRKSQEAIIRGLFCATTRPLQIPNVARLYCLDEKLVLDCVHELIESHELQGVIRGREYLPHVFLEIQQSQIFSFFQDNRFIEHARATKMKVHRPFDYIKKQHPDAIELENVIISESLFLQLEGAIDLAIQEKYFVDVRAVLPSALETADCALLLGSSLAGSASDHSIVISDVFAVSREFLKSFEAYLVLDAEEKAKKAAGSQNGVTIRSQNVMTDSENCVENDPKDRPSKGPRSKCRGSETGKGERALKDRKYRSEDRNKGRVAPVSEDSSGKKGRKPSKRNDRNALDLLSSKQSALSISLTSSEVHSLLRAWDTRLEDEDEELLDGLFDHFSSFISKTYHESLEKELQSNFRGDAVALRSIRKAFEDKFDDVYSSLLIFEMGLHKIQVCADESTEAVKALEAICDHLSNSVGLELCIMITRFIATEHELDLEHIPRFTSSESSTKTPIPPPTKLSDGNKKLLEENLDQAMAHCVIQFWCLATGPRFNDFMCHIPLIMNALNIPMRKLDRKKKRQLIFNYRHKVVAQLEKYMQTDSCQIAPAVALVLQLFFQKCTGFCIELPTEETAYTQFILNCFRAGVAAHVSKEIDEFLLLVNDLSQSDAISDEQKKIWKEALNRVRNVCIEKDVVIQ